MAIKKSQLYTKLWQACDELRGGMDASQYKDYVLVILFIKYISDRAKNGDADLYIDLPKGCTFDDLVALKGKPDIGERMNVILARIGEANEQLADTITNADFADEQKLGKGKDLVETVSNLIGIFQDKDLDLSNNRAADDDLIGDAYEYLMKNFATQSGKSKGQFYTPGEVSRVMARVVNIAGDRRPVVSVYDMACGSGSLLIRAAVESARPFDRIAIEGQELDLATIGMAKMSMVIHGIDDAELKHGNTLSDPLHKTDDTHLKTFDYAFANPPFSVKGWMKGAQENDPFGRWGHGEGVAPVPPPKCGDYAFLLHMIASLKSNGKGAIILPHGVLFRGNAEGDIRKFIVKKHIIRGIIGLPANLFFGTGIPACIIILDKGAALASKGIFMIDAKDGFAKDGAKNRLRECDIRRIVDTWAAQEPVPHYARMVPYAEIEGNDYNLNIPRYIAPADKEVRQDIVAHLKGGIPEDEAAAYPACLFKKLRKGYVALAVDRDDIALELEEDDAACLAEGAYVDMYAKWVDRMAAEAKKLGRGFNPKKLVEKWGGELLARAGVTDGLPVDPYDVYEVFMNYWAEVMQDDCYLVSRDGWQAKLQMPKKKSCMWMDLVCDLLPPDVVAESQFPTEMENRRQFIAETETLESEYDEKMSEAEEDDEIAEAAAALKQKIAKRRKVLKADDAEITRRMINLYERADAAWIRGHVINDKWSRELCARFKAELSRTRAQTVSAVQALANRYAVTLPEAERNVAELRARVAKHLTAMGIKL